MKLREAGWAFFFVLLSFLLWDGASVLVWIYLVPLLVLAVTADTRRLFLWGVPAIVSAAAICLRWVTIYDYKTFGFVTLMWSLFYLGFVLLCRFFCRGRMLPLLVFPPVAWFLERWLISWSPVGDFWTDLAMFHPTMAPLIWFVGARGVTFLVVLANAALAALWIYRSKRVGVYVTILAAVVAGCAFYSARFDPPGPKRTVVVLQGNFDQDWDWRNSNAGTIVLDTYLDMTRKVLPDDPDLIVWPEYAIAEDVFRQEALLWKIVGTLAERQSRLVFGSLRWGEGSTDGMRNAYDTAVIVSGEGVADRYRSVYPFPYETWSLPGGDLRTVSTGREKLGIMLCYEETLVEVGRGLALRGAEMFISLANNSQMGCSVGIWQASLQTRLRAAENGKYLIRSSNTGISQVITPCGGVVAMAKPFVRDTMRASVVPNDTITVYARHGDLLIITVSLLIVLTMIVSGKCSQNP